MPHGALDKEAFKTQLAAMAGVDAAAVRVPETVAAEGGSSVEVCIGPLSTAFADAVGDKLRACTACVADAGKASLMLSSTSRSRSRSARALCAVGGI